LAFDPFSLWAERKGELECPFLGGHAAFDHAWNLEWFGFGFAN
jgi:hypothetical protein